MSNRLLAFNAFNARPMAVFRSSDDATPAILFIPQLVSELEGEKTRPTFILSSSGEENKVGNQTAPGNKKIAVLQNFDTFSSPRMRRLTTRSLAHPVSQF